MSLSYFGNVLVLVEGRTLNCEEICKPVLKEISAPSWNDLRLGTGVSGLVCSPITVWGFAWKSPRFSVCATGMAWDPGRAEIDLWEKKACLFNSMWSFHPTFPGLFCTSLEESSLSCAHLLSCAYLCAWALGLKRKVALNHVTKFTLEAKERSLSLAPRGCFI